ncbi:adhesion G protein-coupled receptor E5-like [Carcharodon carcharias]|uniref:adhesion G protein-coupled receptor E5-like n=1 Tax=Carcharodon carcharias TaxID=13397 RepID=UPI001B7F2906|nr:adhesion G protein-coupled receptor E5-like [Carcharodon carcharias]
MFLEGIQIYLMVQVAFAPKVPLKRFIYWIGYGFPALIVAISAAAYHEGYGTKSICWLTVCKCFVCSFFIPVAIIKIVNFYFLVITLIKLKAVMSKPSSEGGGLRRKRIFTQTAIGQSVILGCAWITGMFYIRGATIPMMYIFALLNSLQGMFIFIMHCMIYKQVREACVDCLAACSRRSTTHPLTATSARQTASSKVGEYA